MPRRVDYYTTGDMPASTWQAPKPLPTARPKKIDNFFNATPLNYQNKLGMYFSNINDPLGKYNVLSSRKAHNKRFLGK